MPSEPALTRAIQRKRRRLFPREPANAMQLHLQDEWTRTIGEDNWLIGEITLNQDRIFIFATEENIRILAVVLYFFHSNYIISCYLEIFSIKIG